LENCALAGHNPRGRQMKNETQRPSAGSPVWSASSMRCNFAGQSFAPALVIDRLEHSCDKVLEDDVPGAANAPVWGQLQIETDHRRRAEIKVGPGTDIGRKVSSESGHHRLRRHDQNWPSRGVRSRATHQLRASRREGSTSNAPARRLECGVANGAPTVSPDRPKSTSRAR
jgi:hypothetical protein